MRGDIFKRASVLALALSTALATTAVAKPKAGWGPRPVKYRPRSVSIKPQLLKPVTAMSSKESKAFAAMAANATAMQSVAADLEASVLVRRKIFKIKQAQILSGINVLTGLP